MSNIIRNNKNNLEKLFEREKHEKLSSQQKYKNMLDEQVNFNKNFKMYGNMTQMEKRMNHNDLYAYKHNDNNQY